MPKRACRSDPAETAADARHRIWHQLEVLMITGRILAKVNGVLTVDQLDVHVRHTHDASDTQLDSPAQQKDRHPPGNRHLTKNHLPRQFPCRVFTVQYGFKQRGQLLKRYSTRHHDLWSKTPVKSRSPSHGTEKTAPCRPDWRVTLRIRYSVTSGCHDLG